jgi:hypothetical protein
MQATQGGAGDILSILPLLPSHKIRSSIPTREAVDANPFSKAGSQDVTVTPSGPKDITASRLRITL